MDKRFSLLESAHRQYLCGCICLSLSTLPIMNMHFSMCDFYFLDIDSLALPVFAVELWATHSFISPTPPLLWRFSRPQCRY
ncbi:hypothetical protein CW304_28860 [Bacillus sp. UFRGS-B20]|nr:hypothetical protein CW304_28860 [Bacillus sp. UFRGS-B20]